MNTFSIKPYLIRAVYEWCTDNEMTPYVSVVADGCSGIPAESVRDEEVILNISQQAVCNLVINNDTLEFMTRFNGVSGKVEVMIGAIKAIFAKELEQGLTFIPEINTTTVNEEEHDSNAESALSNSSAPLTKEQRDKSFLKIVK